MFSFTEQFSAATASARSQIESQLNIANHYATTAFDGVQQVIALNLNTTKSSVEKSSAVAKQLLEAKDPRELVVQAPNFDNVLAYSRELYSIASKTQAELLQLVKDQFREASAATATAAAKPLQLATKVAQSAPVAAVAPVANEPAEAEIADAPMAAPTAPKAAAVKAEPKVEVKVEAKAKPAVAAPAAPVAASAAPATPAKPPAEAVAEVTGKAAVEAAPVAAEVAEAKPVVLKSVSPKK